jgi:hypothetical protein
LPIPSFGDWSATGEELPEDIPTNRLYLDNKNLHDNSNRPRGKSARNEKGGLFTDFALKVKLLMYNN